MKSYEFAVDLGSSYFTIFQKGIGLVLREPNMALLGDGGKTVREIGYKAKNMHSTMLGNTKPVYPIKEGAIVDVETAILVFGEFFKRILPNSIFKPKFSVLALVSESLTTIDRRNVEKVFSKIGAQTVYVCDSPLALYEYTGATSGLFVDIGGGKTEVAAVSTNGIVAGCTVNIGGNALTNAIIDFVAEKYYVKIGEITAEKLKCDSLSFYQNDAGADFITGTNLSDGMPKNIEVSAEDLFLSVAPLIDDLVDVIMSVLSQTPLDIAAEIKRKGFFISGGTSQIAGLMQYLADRIGIYATAIDDVENGIALGGGKFLDNLNELSNLIGVAIN